MLLVTGGDVARILIQHEISDPSPGGKLATWIESVKRGPTGSAAAPCPPSGFRL